MKLEYEFDIIKKELIFTYYKIKSGHRIQMFKHRLIYFPRNYFSNAYYGFGTGQIWLDDVRCNGYECDIAECESQGWGRHDCTHGNDTGVHCGRYLFFNL